MVSRTITIKNAEGLHARPASEIVKSATQYTSSIQLDVNGNKYNVTKGIKLAPSNYGKKNEIDIFPIYMAMFL